MIFLTVGTQLPFDRLVRTVDDWAGRKQRKDILAQIGRHGWRPGNIKWVESLSAEEFSLQMRSSDVIISHAGAGTVFTALQLGKSVIVFPRRADLHEQRNDHQLAMAESFAKLGLIEVAFDEKSLLDKLDGIDRMPCPRKIEQYASEELINTIRAFINGSEQQ